MKQLKIKQKKSKKIGKQQKENIQFTNQINMYIISSKINKKDAGKITLNNADQYPGDLFNDFIDFKRNKTNKY